MKTPFLIGRILFGGFFLYSGIKHLQHKEEIAPYVESKGVPSPKAAVTLSAVPLIAGGTSLLLGVKPKWGALAILGFLAGVSPVMHNFWNSEDPEQRSRDMNDFLKNAALAGAALSLLAVEEPWRASIQIGKPTLGEKLRRMRGHIAA